jgi:hypothetical protein
MLVPAEVRGTSPKDTLKPDKNVPYFHQIPEEILRQALLSIVPAGYIRL